MGNNNGNNAPKRSLCCASHWNEKSTWHSSQIVPLLTACPEGVPTSVSTVVSRSVSNSLSVSATSAAARVQHSFPLLDSLTIDFAAQFALQAKSIRARTLRKRRQQRQRQREREMVRMHNQCRATADCLVHYTRGYLRNVVMIATHKTATGTATAAAATRLQLRIEQYSIMKQYKSN